MIRGEQVNLRAVDRMDVTLLHRWLNEPSVMAFWGAPDHTISLAEVQRRVEGHLADEAELGRPSCLIVETLAGEPIGQVILSRYQPAAGSVELSIMIGESGWWGQGYGTDALRAAVDACFDAWNFNRVWLRSEAGNERAHRLYARSGFVTEAVLREASYVDGEYEDVVVFGLLRSDRQRSAARQAEDSSFVFGLLGSEGEEPAPGAAATPDQQPAASSTTPAAEEPKLPVPAARPAPPVAATSAPAHPTNDAESRPSPPDASEPGEVRIPTAWLDPSRVDSDE
jgi:RimJ/RimL family protein N-acetyltransferase